MTWATEGLAIRSRVASLWTDTSIAWPNRPFTPTVGTAYLRLTIRNGDSLQPYLGKTSKRRSVGVVIGEVFAPVATIGDNSARTLADSFAAIFRNAEHDGITYREPSAREAPYQEEPHYRWIVEVPYYRDWSPGGTDALSSYPYLTITSASTLTVGEAVKAVSGVWSEAQADAEANLAFPAVVGAALGGTSYQAVMPGGRVNVPAHGLGTAGAKVWLSQATAGLLTATEPTSGLCQQIATVFDANHLIVNDYPIVNKG